MKKRSKSILLIIIGIIIGASITVTAALVTSANNITFTPNNTDWNATNTDEALNDLYTTMYSGTALAENILSDKTAVTGGGLLTGSMPNNGTLDWKPELGTTYTVPAGYYSGGTLDSTSAFNKGKTSIENMTLLWKPVPSDNGNPVSYSGTYNFTESYSYVIVVTYTEAVAITHFGVSNLTMIKHIWSGVSAEDVTVRIYKNANTNSSITYSFDNLSRAGIGVFGIK